MILNNNPNEVFYKVLNFILAFFSASGFLIFFASSTALSPLISLFSSYFSLILSLPVSFPFYALVLFLSSLSILLLCVWALYFFCLFFFLLLAIALLLLYLTLFLLLDLAFPLLILALPFFLLSLDLFFILVLSLLGAYFFPLSYAIVLFTNNPLFKQENSLLS